MKFHVPDMSCGHCSAAIDKAVKAIDPTAQIDADIKAKTVSVVSTQAAPALQAALSEAGYPATLA